MGSNPTPSAFRAGNRPPPGQWAWLRSVLAARALQGRHGTLVLAGPQPLVARVLEITGADKLREVRELAGRAGSRLARGE